MRARQVQVAGPGGGVRSLRSRSIICSSSCSVADAGRRSQVGDRLVAGHDAARPGGPAAGSCCPRPASRRRAGARHSTTYGRQVRVERAQAVAEPDAEARHRHGGRAGVHRQHGLEVLDDVGVQRRGSRRARRPSSPRCGNSSLTIRPDSAARREPERRAQQRLLARAAQVAAATDLAVVGLVSFGLGSNVSTCENPPVRKTTIRLLRPGLEVRGPGREQAAAVRLGRQRQRRVQPAPPAARPQAGRRPAQELAPAESRQGFPSPTLDFVGEGLGAGEGARDVRFFVLGDDDNGEEHGGEYIIRFQRRTGLGGTSLG